MVIVSNVQLKELLNRYPNDDILKDLAMCKDLDDNSEDLEHALKYAKQHLMDLVRGEKKVLFVKILRGKIKLSLKNAVDLYNSIRSEIR